MTPKLPPVPDGAVCHYCDQPATTQDHIVAYSKGGRNAENLVPACRPCNQAKGDRLPTCQCDRCRVALARYQAKMRAEWLGYRSLPPLTHSLADELQRWGA